MLELILFSLQVTLPIAILVVLGVWFRRLEWISEPFNQGASKLVFNVALPALLFVNIVTADADSQVSWTIVGFGALFTVGSFFLLSLLSRWVTPIREERGVFVQGSFRGNMGIVGLAFCYSAFGVEGATLASVYLAVLSLVYNVLAVMTLNRWTTSESERSILRSTFSSLIRNPLIIAILVSGVWRTSGVPVPGFVVEAAEYLAQMTLPLALLSIGASLSWSGFISAGRVTAWASLLKLIVLPYMAAGLAFLFGFRGMELGVMYLMMATPTAAASYMMVRAMGGNASLAASIIAVTTVLSLLTTSVGLVAMKAWQWI
ncbi:AEC family transporter [Reinekea blandensis]|uniref:Putative transport protein n=1 Tax=Reinekea blandensis MED297 TaxID=314283 RepID=A4B978_9GAMM|nr:AEC family transporter [Reinekea blandensis]EAR11179.1 putative transport protein [Reinekea sp. MED297] [Reinekea blandensis MED297]